MCERCPARVQCLMHAYDNEIAGGYFGGMSPSRRRKLSRSEALADIADIADIAEVAKIVDVAVTVSVA